jgi:hypothetical protein
LSSQGGRDFDGKNDASRSASTFCRRNTFSLEESDVFCRKEKYYKCDVDENNGWLFDLIDIIRGYGRIGRENDPQILIPENATVHFG